MEKIFIFKDKRQCAHSCEIKTRKESSGNVSEENPISNQTVDKLHKCTNKCHIVFFFFLTL